MLYEQAMNVQCLSEFMKKMVKYADQKLTLILDNLREHHCKPVKEWHVN